MSVCSLCTETRPAGRVPAFRRRVGGYTVVELVVVMVLMGILAASAMPRFFEVSRFDEMGYADSLLGALRYAQKLALASRCDTRVAITSSGYALYQRELAAPTCQSGHANPINELTRPVSRPGGATWSGSTPTGVAVEALDIYFDSQGRPRFTVSGSLLDDFEDFDVGSRTVTLEPDSGLVHGG